MKNFPSSKYCLTLLYLSSLFLHMMVTLPTLVEVDDSPYIYTPTDFITVACGHTGPQSKMYEERYWTGDIDTQYSPLEEEHASASLISEAPPSTASSSSSVGHAVGQVPYNAARLSYSEFTYSFSLSRGQKFIRLYFYPTSYPNFDRSKALFSVKVGGFTLLQDFNASVTADAYGVETLYREFCLNIGKEQSLNITFSPSREASPDAYAFVNGIEIVSMPRNLYYTPAKSANGVSYVGTCRKRKKVQIENNTALEMVYRIHIGGNPFLPNSDTGMYRNWEGLADEQTYLEPLSLSSSTPQQNNYSTLDFAIPEYTAPRELYQTSRSMTSSPTSYNLTWEFPVHSKFSYLVRVHFCYPPQQGYISERVRQIYIANQIAEEVANISEWYPTPVYRDYVVSIGPRSTKKKTNLSIAFYDDYNQGLLVGSTGMNSPHLLGIVAGIVSGILVLISVLGFFIFIRRWKAKSSAKSTKTHKSTLPHYMCPYFSLAKIKAATQNFNESFIIGVGGFGNVYKGCIGGGEATVVAIKRLKPESSQGEHEFKTEIELLSQFRHRHLVSLIGYCTDEDEMILVYDYMKRGTLADHLYHNNRDNPPLPWEQRLQICIGAARGLHYLHSGTQGTIIHRDVKSTNILLDEKWMAKVSDFGLSKMGITTASKTHISTIVKGSFGYLDPEYYRYQRLTEKSDVYSFGVVLWEVLCARPAVVHTAEPRQMNLAEWAKNCHRNGELDQIIDPSMRGKIEIESLNKFVEIAMSCISDRGIEQPPMNDVVRGLEFALQLHQKNIGTEGYNEVTDQCCRKIYIQYE
ncbi:receptor-like protein kinase FERONIA [Pyrus ussuriensis x Pyrus communis]|uniref:Receptor-like protein kinase FERONIA n=1 Tax=Pyrus ussuriensis x Pyrus communis TaxID=2448454 RepID=A0A5N5GAE4_9ROSA|nr:receptor-like protein kinase FERONIA [Pyrus ussuriensis x Pyrus communis]